MLPFDTILTHPGGAHTDEFLACSLLLTLHAVPIVRREPTSAELAAASTCVVDVGHRHEPHLNNFDHHQLPRDHAPTCSLSLVLQHLSLYDEARQFCDWLETAEWFDTRGPIDTAKWLGTTPDVLARLHSPISSTVLKRFALSSRLDPGHPLWEIMRLIGTDMVDYITTLRARLALLAEQAQVWTVDLAGSPAQILFVPRTDPLPDEPSFGLDRFIRSRGLEDSIVALVSPDRRSSGYGLERYRDNPRVDFTRLANTPGVHFTHARGFVAKTTITDITELKNLLTRAAVA